MKPSASPLLSFPVPIPAQVPLATDAEARFETHKVVLVPASTAVINETTQARATGIKEGQELPVLCFSSKPGKKRYAAIELSQLDSDKLPGLKNRKSKITWDEPSALRLACLENWLEFDEARVQKKMRLNSEKAREQGLAFEQKRIAKDGHLPFNNQGYTFVHTGRIDPLWEVPDIHLQPMEGMCLTATAVTNGGHKQQQDANLTAAFNIGADHYQFFCICDGHGKQGQAVAEEAAALLPRFIYKQLLASHKSLVPDVAIYTGLKKAFVDVRHALVTNRMGYKSGTTACVALIHNGVITAANAGDSRAIVIDKTGKTIQLTEDACSSDLHFISSIQKRYGEVSLDPGEENGQLRLGGTLEPARGLGDGDVAGVTARPKITRLAMANGGEGCTVVIGSDGIFDMATNRQIGALVRRLRTRGASAEKIAEVIISLCLTTAQTLAKETDSQLKDYADNMSAMVIFPDQPSQP